MMPELKKDWRKLATHFISDFFPNLGKNDTVSVEELTDCVTEAMENSMGFKLPEEPMGDWVPIAAVAIGERVVAPFNKGYGYMVGTVKIDPYGTGKRVVSNGESFVTPEAVKRLLNEVKAATRPDGGDSLRALQGWADKLEHAHMELRAQGYRDTGLSVEGVHIHAETEMSAAKRQHFSETELAAQDKPAKESLEPLNADRGPKEVLNALSGPASETKLKMAAAINQSYVDELAANEVLREALEWYGEQARLCRLIHSGGDAGRHALANDGGKRAQAALAAKDGEQTNGST